MLGFRCITRTSFPHHNQPSPIILACLFFLESLSEDEHSPIISDSDMSLEGVDAFSIQNEADMFLNPGYNKRLSAE